MSKVNENIKCFDTNSLENLQIIEIPKEILGKTVQPGRLIYLRTQEGSFLCKASTNKSSSVVFDKSVKLRDASSTSEATVELIDEVPGIFDAILADVTIDCHKLPVRFFENSEDLREVVKGFLSVYYFGKNSEIDFHQIKENYGVKGVFVHEVKG